ncbi:MAG: hypothetical protein SGILL_004915 [Bacillariaceae sp.]
MLGEGGGAELVAMAKSEDSDDAIIDGDQLLQLQQSATSFNQSDSNTDLRKDPNASGGMVPRLVSHLFDFLYESTPTDSSVEYSIRCSLVEIYLEKMTDLLHPGRDNDGLRVGRTVLDKDGATDMCVLGATELCCLCPEDVFALLARGQATRTKSAEDANIDSSRSHVVFTLHLEQRDFVAGKITRSRLQVIDCAGSQTRPTANNSDTAAGTENNMINASLNSLHNAVRWTVERQEKKTAQAEEDGLPSQKLSKIASLMIPSIGGSTHTVMICTGAPSSYCIDETIHAIRFAQLVRKVQNKPRIAFQEHSLQMYRSKLLLAERKEQQLTRLIRMMAQESKHGKKKAREPKNPKVWDAILQICDADKRKQKKNGSDTKKKKKKDKSKDEDISISVYSESEQQSEIQDLYSKIIELESNLQRERTAREKAESRNRDTSGMIATLKSQNESLINDKRALEEQLSDAKAEIKSVSMQKTEVDHRLRTSLFRENEAVLFLRQLRAFYFRLLKNKAAHGSGSTREAIEEAKKRLPGVADLEDLLDVDKMMVQSGIIENSEVGGDTLVADYQPSEEALANSSMEAEMAEKREIEVLHADLEEEVTKSKRNPPSITNREATTSHGFTYGQLTACRQKLLKTPAGLLAVQKEQELEQELSELSTKCIGLQNSVNAEKAMVEALSGRQGAATKMKQAQEVIMLKTELERRTNDLLAIVWKMNELHLVNKTIDTKVGTREQHVMYLEDQVSEIQSNTHRALSQRQINERKLREQNSELRNRLESMNTNLWQLGENLDKAPVWRLLVPYSGDDINLDEIPGRRLSSGELTEEEIDGIVKVVEEAL